MCQDTNYFYRGNEGFGKTLSWGKAYLLCGYLGRIYILVGVKTHPLSPIDKRELLEW